MAVIINLKFRTQISLNYEENTVDAEFLVLNEKSIILLEIDTASALLILKLGINALKQNYVFQEFPGCLKGIEIKVLLVLQSC